MSKTGSVTSFSGLSRFSQTSGREEEIKEVHRCQKSRCLTFVVQPRNSDGAPRDYGDNRFSGIKGIVPGWKKETKGRSEV